MKKLEQTEIKNIICLFGRLIAQWAKTNGYEKMPVVFNVLAIQGKKISLFLDPILKDILPNIFSLRFKAQFVCVYDKNVNKLGFNVSPPYQRG